MSERAAGVLLHPTSLPGRFGIGDLGPEAERFVAWAAEAGQSWWQILPLGPPDGDSPYNCLSAFAGNPLLISPERLVEDGFLETSDLADAPNFPTDRVDFTPVAAWKSKLLRRAYDRFEAHADAGTRQAFSNFCEAPQQAWLEDWALYATLRRRNELHGWWKWKDGLKRRDPRALTQARESSVEEFTYHCFAQWQFFSQWHRLHDHARRLGVRVIGDLPIYVSWNSAEVWAAPHLFDLDDEGHPVAVSGAPPDDYCEDGQLWGNPLYRWDRIADDGYAWWIARLRAVLATCDRVRLDHFRGFAKYWRVPADHDTAVEGKWFDGPGTAFFEAARNALGELPIIAEDLGVITPDVDELRHAIGLPGMKVLHFAFGEVDGVHLPHHCEPATAIYTGTHDNDTTAGWYASADREVQQRIRDYTGATTAAEIPDALIRIASTSVAELAVTPIQDVLGLGTEARMNIPGLAEGNWGWRMQDSALGHDEARKIRRLAEVSGRLPSGS